MKKKDYIKQSNALEKKIHSLSKQIKQCPEGKLICARNSKWIKWYLSDGKTLTYLPKSERKLAEKLAKKEYLKTQLKECKKEKRAIDCYIKNHCFDIPMSHKLLTESPGFKELLANTYKPFSEEISLWMEDYEKNTTYPESLIHKTNSGKLVRSKSEVLIDMVLNDYQIPYRYECALYINKQLVYPDFTIMHPKPGELYYWEHFGMVDDQKYLENTLNKLDKYIKGGYIPGINLITTFETKNNPLDIEYIKTLVEQYFS